jgi:tetratricopeptide (TPR) repeat protein
VLLVCENLHWIDTETQAFLESLVDSLPTVRLLLLVNYRPEYHHPWGSKTYYVQLRLDPLPPTSTDALLQALLGDDPSLVPLKRLLMARTEGNPFFLEESVRTLVETGLLSGEPGAYRLEQPVHTLHVPATVHAVLAARIDRLPPEEKRLLQTAAVIGTEVPLPLLQAIAELPEDGLHRGLALLQAAEFLYETRLFPEHVYTFKHALTHEVTYGSLLLERRRALHARIVEALEALAGERVAEDVERLAHHALRGEVWDKALTYCRQAGEKAMAQSAYREAAGYFEQALSALAYLPEQRDTREQAIDLRFALRNALLPLGEHARIFDLLRAAEALAERWRDDQRLGRIANYLCLHFSVMGEYDRAIAAGQRALALATTSGAFDVQVVAQTYLGIAYNHVGDIQQALDVSRRVVALLTGERRSAHFGQINLPAVSSRFHVAWCLAELGGFTEGRELSEEAVRLAEAIEKPYTIAFALIGVGLLARRQGNIHTAIPVLERGLGLCQSVNIPLFSPMAASHLGCGVYPRRTEGRGPPAPGPAAGAHGHWERYALPGPCAHRVERGLTPRRPRRRGACPGRMPPRSLSHPHWTRLPGACPPPPRRGRQALRSPGRRPGRHPLPPSPRPGRGTRYASAPGPLPPRPRHAICHDRPSGAGSGRVVYSYRDVPGHGDDPLAAPGGGGTGTGGGAVRDYDAILAEMLALILAGDRRAMVWGHRIGAGRRPLPLSISQHF